MMKHIIFAIALLGAAPASAACYADYKAKQDNPLRLHYGVVKLTDDTCEKSAAGSVIAKRIGKDGWTLLTVISVFDDAALNGKKASAGAYFLRY
ncbi:MAG: hypothetical protein V7657_03000 [Falsihalocynthiibacter arcticus]